METFQAKCRSSCNLTGLLAAVLIVLSTSVLASAKDLVANFDSLNEGFPGTSFVDGGITFFDAKASLDDSNTVFGIDSRGAQIFEQSGGILSSPNVLSIGGISQGSGDGLEYFAAHGFSIDPGNIADSISIGMNAFVIGSVNAHLVALELTLEGTPVASTLVDLYSFQDYYTLAIAGVAFDRARVFAGGGADNMGQNFFGVFDEVRIHLIPEPLTIVLVTSNLGALSLSIRSRRQIKSLRNQRSMATSPGRKAD